MQHRNFIPRILVLWCAWACTAPARADDAPGPAGQPASAAVSSIDAADSGGGGSQHLDRVVVTSQKRQEALQDVPISISVLGGDDLQQQRIENYDDIARAVPGVSFNSVGANEGLTNIVIRGVSSTSGAATVGTYIDDVSITVKNFYDGSSQPRLFDVDRIEVLRGPQGTLYGASSEGGTIRFVSRQPNLQTFSSEVSLDTSGTTHGGTNSGLTAVLNVPLIPDTLAIRASAGYTDDSGYIDHLNAQGQVDKAGVNVERSRMVRLTATWLAGDDLIIKPSFFYQQDWTADNSAFYPGLGLWQQNKQVPEYGNDAMTLSSLSVEKSLGFADLTSVTGLFHRGYDRQQDGTYYNSTVFATAFLDPLYPQFQPQNDALIGTLASPVKYSTDYRQFSQEFRLASPDADRSAPLQWVGGLYFSDQRIHNTNFQRIPGINTVFQQIYGIPMEQSLVNSTYGAPGVNQLFPDDIDESDNRSYTERQVALFGQLDYQFTPRLHGSLGAREVLANEDFQSAEIGFYQIGNINPYYQSSSFRAFTPKVALKYDVSADTNVYGSVAKGFRLGGPTGPIVFGPTSVCAGDFAAIGQTSQPTKFGSDSLWTYELGAKSSLADNLYIDAATFYTRWDNIQQQIYLPTCGYYFTSNVGNALIYGGEVQVDYRPLPGLTLGMTGSIEHATIISTSNASTVPLGANLIDVPSGTATASVAWKHGLGIADGLSISCRADYSWTGTSNGSYQASNSNFANPSYGVLNASVGLSRKDVEVTLYAKNLANDRTLIQRPEINTVVEGYTVRPRTFGLTARFSL